MMLIVLVLKGKVKQRLYREQGVFLEGLVFLVYLFLILVAAVKDFTKIVARRHLVFVSCDDNSFSLENSREVVFQFQLTGFIKNDIVKVEVLSLEKVTTAIGGGEYYREKGGE